MKTNFGCNARSIIRVLRMSAVRAMESMLQEAKKDAKESKPESYNDALSSPCYCSIISSSRNRF